MKNLWGRWRNRHSGTHLVGIAVQWHPYLGWVTSNEQIGGEAAALGLVDLPTWSDDEVSVNINGHVAHLKHFENTGIEEDFEKPHTELIVI